MPTGSTTTAEPPPTRGRAPKQFSRNRHLRFDPWVAATLLVAFLVAVPVATLPFLALFPEENIWPHLVSTVLPRYVRTTLALMLCVGAGTLLLGVSTAWLVTMTHFPGRRLMEWALLLPLAMPAYVVAYVYTDLLEYAGPVQRALRGLFGWQSAADYRFPEIRSLGGAACMLTLVLYPYVYMLARSAFLQQSVAALEAARTLGCGQWAAFRRVAMPAARPAIAAGLALALMETLNDFGTVDFFGVQTLTAGIYDVWLNMGNLGGASQIASVMLLFVITLIVLERYRRRGRGGADPSVRNDRLPRLELPPAARRSAAFVCTVIVVLGFLLPAAVLLDYAVRYFEQSWTADFRRFALNSLLLATTAAVTTVGLAMLLAYSQRLRGGRWVAAANRIAGFGYAVPGAVLAVGVLIPVARIDNSLDALAREWLGISTGLVLSGTVFAVLFAYVVRFLTVPLGAVEASLAKVTPVMDMAARSLGHGPGATFLKVHLPLVRSGALTGGIIVFVDCMKELPATLILRPFDFDTLATHLYQFASDEQIETAALGALTIVATGLLPVLLLSRALSGARRPADRPEPGIGLSLDGSHV